MAVLGVFDGVHLAHQKIIRAAVKKARATKGESVVLTFWPHPQKEDSLCSLEHRLRLIGQLGIDTVIVLGFNRKFARISADNFIKNILVKKIHPEYIYVGKNFTFGRAASGNYKLLSRYARDYGYKLNAFGVIKVNNKAVSSTYIRSLIRQARLGPAEKLLGRKVSVLGTVIKGSSLARRLGFPTANVDPHHEVVPPSGVYAVEIYLAQKKLFGVCSIGTKPTFNAGKLVHIEVHIFNFHKNIYHKILEIYFVRRIRAQRKFTSQKALTKKIKKDIISAKQLFSLH